MPWPQPSKPTPKPPPRPTPPPPKPPPVRTRGAQQAPILWINGGKIHGRTVDAARLGLRAVYICPGGGWYWMNSTTTATLQGAIDDMCASVSPDRLGVVIRCYDSQVQPTRSFWGMDPPTWAHQLDITTALGAELKAAGIPRLMVDSEDYFAEGVERPWGVYPTPRLAWTREHDPAIRGREWASALLAGYGSGPFELALNMQMSAAWYLSGFHDFWKAAWAVLGPGGIYAEDTYLTAPLPPATLDHGPVPKPAPISGMPVPKGAHPMGLSLSFPGVPYYIGLRSWAVGMPGGLGSATALTVKRYLDAGSSGCWLYCDPLLRADIDLLGPFTDPAKIDQTAAAISALGGL